MGRIPFKELKDKVCIFSSSDLIKIHSILASVQVYCVHIVRFMNMIFNKPFTVITMLSKNSKKKKIPSLVFNNNFI